MFPKHEAVQIRSPAEKTQGIVMEVKGVEDAGSMFALDLLTQRKALSTFTL